MKYGCIGRKLGHSFSKIIHNELYDGDYRLFELEPEEIDGFMTKRDFRAINVTIPYKQTVIPYLSYISEEAKKIGAVNTVVNKNGVLYGYNTDYAGMTFLIKENGIDLRGKKVLILGSGGTSKTANAVAHDLGAKQVLRVSRNGSDGAVTYDEMYKNHTDADVIINTTPVGMYPDNSGLSADISKFPALSGVADAIYNPLCSRLVSDAKARGIRASGGLLMLVAQAVYAAEYFLERKFDTSELYRVYKKISKDKTNIVLTGMAGCGKSTVGKVLAAKTGRELIDTDRVILEKTGKSAGDIIRENGEAHFRTIESRVIADISKEGGKIIATGGGVPTRSENVYALKQNGIIFLIDRPLEKIIEYSKNGDRPLSSTESEIRALYKEREGIYKSTADVTVGDGEAESIADTVLKEFEKCQK